MAINDSRSQLLPRLALGANFTSNTFLSSADIDTKDEDGGIIFTFLAPDYTDGTYDFVIYEGDDPFFPLDPVPSDKIIGSTTISIQSAQVDGGVVPSVGVFSNKRYLRVQCTSSSVTTGAVIAVLYQGAPEVAPSVNLIP